MNWSLISRLSLFALAMGFATVFVLPSNLEPFFWLVIFCISAYALARAGTPLFLSGLMLGILNSVWVTATHMLFYADYIVRHPQEAQMMANGPLSGTTAMAVFGPAIGLISGCVIGLFAWIAGRFVKPAAATT